MFKQLSLFIVCMALCCCATNSSIEGNPPISDETQSNKGTELSIPGNEDSEQSVKKMSYFAMINDDILKNIQAGDPQSIKLASSGLRKGAKTSEQEKVLLYITNAIIDFAWPSAHNEKVQLIDLPVNKYTLIVDSIIAGTYDNSFEDMDFFTLTIPSLILLSNKDSRDYYEQSKQDLEDSLEMYPNSVLTAYLLGTLHKKMENYSKALEYFDYALDLQPNVIEIFYSYVDVLFLQEKNQQAYDFLKESLLVYPTDSILLELCARATYELGNFELALNYINDSLAIDSKNPALTILEAKVLFATEKYFESSTLLEQYNKIDVDSLLLKSKLEYSWKKNSEEAISIIEEALDLYADTVDIILYAANLSVITGKKVQNKTASELLAPLIEKDPLNREVLEILLEDSFLRGEWEVAYSISSDITKDSEIKETIVLRHVQICLELGFVIEAREFLMPLYNESPTEESFQQAYLQLLIAEEKFDEAEILINVMLPKSSSSTRSMLYFERSKMQTNAKLKLADLRASLTSNPRNESTLYELYSYYFDKADYYKAQYYIKQVMVLRPNAIDIQEKYQELVILLK